MKAVLISIQPKWCELIASGKKTVEVRKTVPKLNPPFKCYIYCTKKKKPDEYGNLIFYKDHNGICVDKDGEGCSPLLTGMVVGEFVYDGAECFTTNYYTMDRPQTLRIARAACLGLHELTEYEGNALCLYGWRISDLKIYDDPKPLSDFYKCGALSPEELDDSLCGYCSQTDCGDKKEIHTPNGTWMCEGRWCNDAYQEYLDDEFALTRPPQSYCYVEGV